VGRGHAGTTIEFPLIIRPTHFTVWNDAAIVCVYTYLGLQSLLELLLISSVMSLAYRIQLGQAVPDPATSIKRPN
jgi:hypothetical protein